MKTAEQMYNYCMDNDYGVAIHKKWGIKHFKILEKALMKDEEVFICFMGYDRKNSQRFAYTVTSKRIIMGKKKMIGQIFQSIDIDKLNDVSLKTTMMSGIITIDTVKEKLDISFEKSVAINVNNSIHEILFSLKEQKKPSSNSPIINSADEIIKYKNLLDMGAITQEEYDKKKKELLNI